MKIAYQDWKPRKDSLIMVNTANDIIEKYEADGYTLTLRQLYYQFVTRLIIKNKERNYHNLGTLMTKARLAGLVSWESIEDRGRGCLGWAFTEDHMQVIGDLEFQIKFDQWERQDSYVEVWVEKEALSDIVAKACLPRDVPYLSCKGYLSASEAWRSGQRFLEKMNQDKHCVLIHLGDHDPSGIDMTRDNIERLKLFTGGGVEVRRIALNMDQVEEYKPPPNPTKLSDTRAKDYIRRFGYESWELDALEPRFMVELIQSEIEQYVDQTIWDEVNKEEDEQRKILRKVNEKWNELLPILEA